MPSSQQHIQELISQLEALLPMLPERQAALDEKFILEFNYNSNHLEGNTLTFIETKAFLLRDVTSGTHTLREYEEMSAHAEAFKLIKEWAGDKSRRLLEVDIKNLNKLILVKPYWNDAITPEGAPTKRQIDVGVYKQYPNSVRQANGSMFEYASVVDTPIQMQELMRWYDTAESEGVESASEIAAKLHYKFVRIHPFDDGNGRIARLLMNYILIRHGLPPVVIKSSDKTAYRTALAAADAGNTQVFVDYIEHQLLWSLQLSIKAALGENIEEDDDIDKKLELLRRRLETKENKGVEGTAEVICDEIERTLIPFFEAIESKVAVLSGAFERFERQFQSEFAGEHILVAAGIQNAQWDRVKESWLNGHVRAARKTLRGLQYFYDLLGFKKSITNDSIAIHIEVRFNTTSYTIVAMNNISQEFGYGDESNKNAVNDVVRQIVTQVIQMINELSAI